MPHHEDDDLAVNTRDFLAEQRRKHYGGLNLQVFPRFEPPFAHLNYLQRVVEDDCDAIMNVNGEPMIGGDMFFVMQLKWKYIESSAEAHGYDIFLAQRAEGNREMLREAIERFRRDLAKLEAALTYWQHHGSLIGVEVRPFYASEIPTLYERDYHQLIARDQDYNASWKKRGGVGAFMMLARKWDRFQPMVEKHDSMPLRMLQRFPDRVDDVSDLRRYLMLVTAERLYRQDVET